MGDEVRILARFVPSRYQSEVIETEIKAYLPPCCARERVSVRIPQGITPHPNNLEWHQDGGGREGTVRHMVVWASETPTEIKTSTGVVVTPKSHQLVWFDNDRVSHRQPRETNESTRWFVSVRCSGALV